MVLIKFILDVAAVELKQLIKLSSLKSGLRQLIDYTFILLNAKNNDYRVVIGNRSIARNGVGKRNE